ncbi:MAG: endonuclease MutS2, partial [Erysipelotrichaceae bacterium]|nr:endonuclease MutS2 [Erysipelotrichaceae bacterium]
MKQELYKPLQLDLVKKDISVHCSFSLGKAYVCKQMPIFDYLWVKRELERGKEAYQLLVKYGMPPFEGIEDTTQSIQASCKDKMLLPHELRKIAMGMKVCLHMQQYNKESELETPQIQELISSFSIDHKLLSQIEHCISANDEVLDRASIELGQIRKQIRNCENDIHKTVQQFVQTHASSLMDTITTKRNDRICVLVKISEKNNIRGFLHGESASGLTAYIEPACILQLNNALQSFKDQEQKEIEKILIALSKDVKQNSYSLLANLETLAVLDASFAKAIWCHKHEGCFAEIKRHDRRLYFQKARHPLIPADKVVANTYEVKHPYDSLLITGSNTGGKTVTLKTIGLFVTLTMAGFPILAQEAEIPFYDGIYIDIGDDQSIQESLSTFSSHLSKLSFICKKVTNYSLVILDELGSGTDPKEGEALAVALLAYLRKKQAMVLATTHFSALKNYASQQESILLSSVAFDMEEMKPTYHYREGVSGTSNAFEIAARFQLDASIIEEAKAFKEKQKSKWDEQSEKLEIIIQENNELKHQLEEKIANVHQLQKDLEIQKEQMHKQKEAWIEKAQKEAQQYMETIKEQADTIIDDLKQLSKDSKPHEYIALKKELDELEPQALETKEQATYHFSIGDYVNLKPFHYHGEIVALHKEQATILVNGIKMKALLKDMEPLEKPSSKKKEKGYTTVKKTSFSMELNI